MSSRNDLIERFVCLYNKFMPKESELTNETDTHGEYLH